MSGADNNRRTNIMARTVRMKVYKFDELNKQAQEKAIEKHFDINTDHEWWEYTYDDARAIGLKITGFSLDRNSYCKGELINSAYEVANKIKETHGAQCETFKTAVDFIAEWDELVKQHSDGITVDKVIEENEYDFDITANEMEEEFKKQLLEDYRIMLQKEYEYLTSSEAIKETLISNEYEFTQDGRIF